MTKDEMNECEKKWGGEGTRLYNAEWVRRLDVLLADERVSQYPVVKRRLQGMRRHAIKVEQQRLRKIQECFDGKYNIHAPYERITHAHGLYGYFRTQPRAWCCPSKSPKQTDSMCPFCMEDFATEAFTSDKLRYDGLADGKYWTGVKRADRSLAKSWGDLNLNVNRYDFNDPATQEQSHDCAVFAAAVGRYLNIQMTEQGERWDTFYMVLVDGQFVKVEEKLEMRLGE